MPRETINVLYLTRCPRHNHDFRHCLNALKSPSMGWFRACAIAVFWTLYRHLMA